MLGPFVLLSVLGEIPAMRIGFLTLCTMYVGCVMSTSECEQIGGNCTVQPIKCKLGLSQGKDYEI